VVGVLWAAAVLLGVAGVGKLFRPQPTSRAVIAAELPAASVLSRRPVVRLIGAAEIVIAGLVLGVGGSWPAALLAAAYLVLATVAWRMIRLAPDQDCGCFGTADEPSSRWHVAVNLAGAAIGVAAACWPQESVGAVVEQQGLQDLLLLGGSLVLALAGYLLLTAMPALARSRAKVATPR
jgi:hypothetical protein